MFTGLVEEMGIVEAFDRREGASHLHLRAAMANGCTVGESVAVNGCCLTVTARGEGRMEFELLEETLRRTNLGGVAPGGAVNLERALRADGRLGGHFVQGHVDCVARVLRYAAVGEDYRLEVELGGDSARYVVEKGSIAVNGISLTVAEAGEGAMTLWIIPHTREVTNLRGMKEGDLVNVEFDILGKYVERLMGAKASLRLGGTAPPSSEPPSA